MTLADDFSAAETFHGGIIEVHNVPKENTICSFE